MTLYKWSQTASSDATADSTINWAEGQSPSSVNDSARAMMAATAKYRDDIAGAIVTGGTSTAYTITSSQVFDTLAHMNGAMIAFSPHATNGATVTLNVDALGAKPLRSAPSVELLAGTIVQGTPYVATYNNSDAVWYLRGFFGNPYNIPLAGGMPFFAPTAPNSSFVFPFGQAVSRTTYTALFSLVSTAFGVGDGSTTFNLPDLRGRVPVGKDNMGGSTIGRVTSITFSPDAITLGAISSGVAQGETITLSIAQLPVHSHSNTLTDPGHTHNSSNGIVDSLLQGGGGSVAFWRASAGGGVAIAASNTTGISINNANAGSGAAVGNVQPSLICNYIMRII